MTNKIFKRDSPNKVTLAGNQEKIDIYEIELEVTALPYDEATKPIVKTAFLSHTMMIIIAVSIILALLLLCCISLCLMKRWKKKYYNCLQKGGEEKCDPNCGGSRRPLLRRDKSADSLMSRTSNSSMID